MALAAYNCIKDIYIPAININALRAAANLFCLLGQEDQNNTLIDAAKTAASSFGISPTDGAINAAAYYNVGDLAGAANEAGIAGFYSAGMTVFYSPASDAVAAQAAVAAAYDSTPANILNAFTCAAGLIYLDVYTSLTQ